jgi:type IV pilus assembly protein PilY1
VSLPATTVYAGDLQGNVWRVDITNSNPTLWVTTVIYQARDNSGNMQPITTTPAITLNPQFPQLLGTMVNVGTGQLLGLPDLTTTGTQTLYGIFDPPSVSAPPLGFAGIPTRSNLTGQTLSNSTAAGLSVRVVATPQPVTLPMPDRGWYVDLIATGERIVTNPELGPGGAVVLTTYQPNQSSCVGGGNAWLMVFNFATGASFPHPELALNGTGQFNSSDQTASGLNPVGVSLCTVYASEPTLIGGSGGSYTMALVTTSGGGGGCPNNGCIVPYSMPSPPMKRISWWEVLH